MTSLARPQPGDLIRIAKSEWYDSHGDNELYQVTEPGGWCERDEIMFIRQARIHRGRSFWGKSSAYSDGPEHMSTSGGPFRTVKLTELEGLRLVGATSNRFWRWQDVPRADGGEEYERSVNLWEADLLAGR